MASASPGGIGWGIGESQSSFFGILGKAIGVGVQTNTIRKNNNKCENSSLPMYTRLGSRLSVSRGSSSDLCLEDWIKNKSTNNIRIERSKSTSRSSGAEQAGRSLTRRARKIVAKRGNRRGLGRSIEQEDGYGENYYDICCDASLSTMVEPETDVAAMTSPIVPLTISFDGQTGEEFADPETMDRLVASGLEMATKDQNDWIEWKEHSSTRKLLEEYNNNEMAILEQGEVLVYIGKSKKEGHGSKLPIIKTKSILPLSAEEMADLLMDSTKVKIYNKLSVGRTDVRILGKGTKVVCNLTKPPIAKSNMVSCTLMHSRKLEGSDSSHLVVSRATPGMVGDELSDLPRNDILLGVNLLEDRGPNECVMTAVTHVYSPALPMILAKKLGVSSAINFVKDIRGSCGAVGS